MPSIFAYYRPRGVQGNYIVAILLDLLESETATVNVSRKREAHAISCGSCGIQRPTIVTAYQSQPQHPEQTINETGERRWELYRITNMVIKDYIEIEIHDNDVVPVQNTRYTAFSDDHFNEERQLSLNNGFSEYKCRFGMNNIDFGVISLNHIDLIDWDKKGKQQDHDRPEFQRVQQLFHEGLPVQKFDLSQMIAQRA